MIAPSYQTNYTIQGEPFTEGGKTYVIIKHNRTQNERKARWYTEKEFYKAFPKEKNALDLPTTPANKKHKVRECLGFSTNGAVTIFNEPFGADINNDFMKKSVACYHKLFGWYVRGKDEVPQNLPEGCIPIVLQWETVGDNEEYLLSDREVINAIKMARRCAA